MKTYIKPASVAVEFRAECVVAASPTIACDPTKQTNDNFSHRRGWNSDDWTATADGE